MSRELKFDESWTPLSQVPMRELNEQSSQYCWIALDFSAKEFCLTILTWDAQKRDVTKCGSGWGKWKDFWRVLATLDLGRRKHWLIGWGVGYALDRADFIGALGRGEVVLPKKKHADESRKHTGSLIMSGQIFEVDAVCGRNKIKLIDFANFGVDRPAVKSSAADNIHCLAAVALSSYLRACSTCRVIVNRTTAAQVGWVKARQTLSVARPCCNLDFVSRELERAAYHGGRCEAFRLGVIPGTTYSLDVRACYATICRDERLPFVCVAEYLAGCDPARIDPDGDDHWIADVVIRTDKADYPLRWMGTPIFPVGQFRTVLPWPELRRSLRRGHVVRVLRAARYEAAPVLREYAEWYLDARAKADKRDDGIGSGWLKAMFNASLGYTARRKYEWQPWDIDMSRPYWIGTTNHPEMETEAVHAQKLGDERRWLKIAGEPREAIPYLHATICSYARVKLLDIFETAGRQNVLYCDTDGVLVTEAGALNLCDDTCAGDELLHGLVERFAPGPAKILGQKTYQVGSAIIASGITKTRRSKLGGTVDRITVGADNETGAGGELLRVPRVLTTPTGRVSLDGVVTPFEFRCEDSGNIKESWINEEV